MTSLTILITRLRISSYLLVLQQLQPMIYELSKYNIFHVHNICDKMKMTYDLILKIDSFQY